MSCYFRHMKDVLDEAGIRVDKENKKDVDRIIHEIVGVEYKDCSPTWKERCSTPTAWWANFPASIWMKSSGSRWRTGGGAFGSGLPPMTRKRRMPYPVAQARKTSPGARRRRTAAGGIRH